MESTSDLNGAEIVGSAAAECGGRVPLDSPVAEVLWIAPRRSLPRMHETRPGFDTSRVRSSDVRCVTMRRILEADLNGRMARFCAGG